MSSVFPWPFGEGDQERTAIDGVYYTTLHVFINFTTGCPNNFIDAACYVQ